MADGIPKIFLLTIPSGQGAEKPRMNRLCKSKKEQEKTEGGFLRAKLELFEIFVLSTRNG